MQAFANMRPTGLMCVATQCAHRRPAARLDHGSPTSNRSNRRTGVHDALLLRRKCLPVRLGGARPARLAGQGSRLRDKAAAPYFDALAAWYETLRVGVSGPNCTTPCGIG